MLFMEVKVAGELVDSLLSFARGLHPRESILLLRGRREGDGIVVEEFLFPPFASTGRGFAEFPSHMLPIDFSVIGTVHSHPSGSTRPSPTDLHHFYGRIMMIVAYPYSRDHVAVYNKRGEELLLDIT